MNDDDDDELGARWWTETLTLPRLARRGVPLGLLGGAALGLSACDDYLRPDVSPQAEAQRLDDLDRAVDALALQRASGWNVGRPDQSLAFSGSLTTDSDGSERWRTRMESLASTLSPANAVLRPWYVPTLFQSLIGPGALGLRAVLRPVHTPEMGVAFQRGLAVRSLLEQAGWPRDIAVVVDAPGPQSVAIGAALSDHFDPVFAFGNWPHPLGVVPAHQTLAAALFFDPLFERTRAQRAADAPPVFVLDAARLSPYVDEDEQFDNRYLVKLPDASGMAALGIKHVLYLSADGTRELDDLNASFVDLQLKGVDVRMLALEDFVRDDEAVALSDAEDDDDEAPRYVTAFADRPWFYFYGGDWWLQVRFWDSCGWGWTGHDRGHGGPPRGVTIGAPHGGRLRPLLTAHNWSPSVRATIFGDGSHARPVGGVGQVTVRASRTDGHITGVRAGRSGSFAFSGHGFGAGRSGSFGRTGGGGFSA